MSAFQSLAKFLNLKHLSPSFNRVTFQDKILGFINKMKIHSPLQSTRILKFSVILLPQLVKKTRHLLRTVCFSSYQYCHKLLLETLTTQWISFAHCKTQSECTDLQQLDFLLQHGNRF